MKEALAEACESLNIVVSNTRRDLHRAALEDTCSGVVDQPLSIVELEASLRRCDLILDKYMRVGNGIVTESLYHTSLDLPLKVRYQLLFEVDSDAELIEVTAKAVWYEVNSPYSSAIKLLYTFKDAGDYIQSVLHEEEINGGL